MFKLPVRTWILNAATVISRQHGAVTRQAEQSGCSRETVYEHARKVEQRLADEPEDDIVAELRAENRRLHEAIAVLKREAESRVVLDKDKQRQFATIAFAMGVSPRQIEDLLGVLLPRGSKSPTTRPSAAGSPTRPSAQANRPQGPRRGVRPRVQTLAVDEIFFGGGRPWSGSSPRA